jgi:hypothetical protein
LPESNEIQFEFSGLEPATGDVIITYFSTGDDSPNSYYDLKVDAFTLGQSVTGQNTACTDYVESPTTDPVSAGTFNMSYLKNGVLKVSMKFDDFLDNGCGNGQAAFVSLEYPVAGACSG